MSEELSGKIAIITGGARGIGGAAVEMFVREGAKVVIADVEEERGKALADSLGPAAAFKFTDVTKADQVEALVDFAVDTFGGLNVMWNNAGISCTPYLRFIDDELNPEEFQKVMSVNVYGVMLGTRTAARYMKDHGGGSIINTASMGGLLPGYGVVTYRASKAAVLHFTKCVAIDFGEYNVRVNCIHPGQIETEMTTFAEPGMSRETMGRINAALEPLMMDSQPIKLRGQPDDIANAGVYLASDRSRYVSGTEITVDGGHSAGDPVNHLDRIMKKRAEVLANL